MIVSPQLGNVRTCGISSGVYAERPPFDQESSTQSIKAFRRYGSECERRVVRTSHRFCLKGVLSVASSHSTFGRCDCSVCVGISVQSSCIDTALDRMFLNLLGGVMAAFSFAQQYEERVSRAINIPIDRLPQELNQTLNNRIISFDWTKGGRKVINSAQAN